MKAPDTKTILNITLIVAIIVVGKKLGEKLGIFNTTEDTTAAALETGSTENISNVSSTAPVGLSLNPNYWKAIFKSVKPFPSGLKMLHSLTIFGTDPLKPQQYSVLTVENFLKTFIPVYNLVNAKNELDKISKLKKLNSLEQTYAALCMKIYDSKGFFSDNPDRLNGVFQQLNSKAQISYLSMVFNKVFDKDLTTYLTTFLNSTELTKISNIIKNKPLYTNLK
jgi:hypothetical protein